MDDIERRAIEAELPSVIERLRSCATRKGFVSHRAFAVEADRLGFRTDEQQRRLRNGLAAVGISVKPPHRGDASHSPAPASGPRARGTAPPVMAVPLAASPDPGPTAAKAARRLIQARRMLARYAEADGTVSKLAHEGVVRLHGLSPVEARELIADFPITRLGTSVRLVAVGGRPRTAAAPAVSAPAPTGAFTRPAIGGKPTSAVPVTDSGLVDAVRAARDVLEADRWRRDVGKVILKAEEEVGLAVLLRGGTDDLGRDVPEEEIAALPCDGERWRAYECLVLHNTRLVWSIARQDFQGQGLEVEDLVQHGYIGLLRAIRKFDASMGTKLSTYATWWIKQAVGRAIAVEGTLIRLPVHLREKVRKVAGAERRLINEGRPTTVENVVYVTGMKFAEVEKLRRISRPTDSLDRIIGDDLALRDLITGPSRLPGPEAVLLRKEFLTRLRHVLEQLPERERHTLVRRTGLDGNAPDTLGDIGAVFGVTRERIRQIESKVMLKFCEELVRHGLISARP